MNIRKLLSKNINKSLLNLGINSNHDTQVRRSVKPQFGDYQVNGIMEIARKLQISPMILANNVVKLLNLKGIIRNINIVSPGFINIFLECHWLASLIKDAVMSTRLGIINVIPKTIVVDYSSPNAAKEMHVGHLRSTIIGDSVVRTLKFLGHKVIKANHLGDWGTHFGMLIAYLEKIHNKDNNKIKYSNLECFYILAKELYDKDPEFANKSRDYVVKLQQGDKHCLNVWRKLVDITINQNQNIYNILNVTLKNKDIMGESLYNSMLPNILYDLKKKKLAVKSKDAIVVFLDEFKNKNGQPIGVIIQKKDGAYLYTTTDIACLKYRYEILKADRIIYYIDSRQHQHLMQVWIIARKAGYIPESLSLEHHMFGMILGKDGKPFKTRSGKTIKLKRLINEALIRAKQFIKAKNPSIKSKKLKKLTYKIGIGAIKYADLSKNRITDYIFNWDNILNFEGNTALYIQYAYIRIISIFRKNDYNEKYLTGDIYLLLKIEKYLAIQLLQLEEVILKVVKNGTPHILCTYLYDLASSFSIFYEKCPILHAKNDISRNSRLQLAILTARTLKKGLNLLGIEVVEYM